MVKYKLNQSTIDIWSMSNKFYPKDLFCSIRFPNKRFVEFSIRLKNVPGALAKVSNLLAERGVNILSGFLTANPGEGEATLGLFTDFTNVDLEPRKLTKQIMELDVVSDVRFSKAVFDVIVDSLHFPLTVSGRRSIVFRVETMGSMFEGLRKTFGSGGDVILYEMGLEAGVAKAKRVVEEYGVGGLKALQVILAERIAKGWGIPEILDFNEHPLEAVIKVRELFECMAQKGKCKEAGSLMFRGYLVGVFNKLFNKEVSIAEVECIAKGDPHCKFVIKSK